MRGRVAVLGLVLGATSSLVVEGVAVAADGAVLAAGPVAVNGPVGIVAVAFGAVGLVAGLVRRRRAAVVRAATPAAPQAEVRPATTGV
ncbi:hypothetical protein [Saccharothrix longispora]|uniref:hypothetical protein n=1 Tax=Saccharothrix longispora TaxID=33920 RepID=UPI0028FDA4B7|nr:hypothetical protein [Saccharothrix longispora]MBY8849834.1 hypothetical protein [Saccharothrix sp. MB29]MDU0293350.1 hypothetical protein [Saccharothrix longispora]